MFNPTSSIKRDLYFFVMLAVWLVYLLFEPISAMIAACFLLAAVVISHLD